MAGHFTEGGVSKTKTQRDCNSWPQSSASSCVTTYSKQTVSTNWGSEQSPVPSLHVLFFCVNCLGISDSRYYLNSANFRAKALFLALIILTRRKHRNRVDARTQPCCVLQRQMQQLPEVQPPKTLGKIALHTGLPGWLLDAEEVHISVSTSVRIASHVKLSHRNNWWGWGGIQLNTPTPQQDLSAWSPTKWDWKEWRGSCPGRASCKALGAGQRDLLDLM